jgi:hypothetical protein
VRPTDVIQPDTGGVAGVAYWQKASTQNLTKICKIFTKLAYPILGYQITNLEFGLKFG